MSEALNLGGVPQYIESLNQTLKRQLDLERHGGRTTKEVYTRVAQRLLAMAAGIQNSGHRHRVSARTSL